MSGTVVSFSSHPVARRVHPSVREARVIRAIDVSGLPEVRIVASAPSDLAEEHRLIWRGHDMGRLADAVRACLDVGLDIIFEAGLSYRVVMAGGPL